MNPMASAAQRHVYLFFIAICLAALLSFDDHVQRLGACVGLIFFAQLREISLLSEVEPVRLNKKAKQPLSPAISEPILTPGEVELGAKKGFAEYMLVKRERDAEPPPAAIIG